MRQTYGRRRFLKHGGIALASLGWAPSLLAAEQMSEKNLPMERLTFGAIGTSEYRAGVWDQSEPFDGRGSQIGRMAAGLGEMIAVADTNLPFAKRFADYFPGRCQAFQDYREVLSNPSIDAVTIGTPDHWHVKIAVEAMRAGKHVYVEKPLSLTMAESKLIAGVARETGKTVQVGSQQRTENIHFLRAAAICRSGRLGKIREIYCSCPGNESIGHRGMLEDRTPFKPQPVPEGFDWNLWLGPAPWAEYFLERCFYNFRWWLDYSGGEITNWGGHNVDFGVWAANLTDAAPVAVEGMGKFPNIPGWYDTAEEFDVRLRYADGTILRLLSGKNEVIFTGENGRIRVNRGGLTGKPVETLTEEDNRKLEEIIRDELLQGWNPRDYGDGNHMRNFVESIRDGKAPISTVFSTINGINACHMANICIRTGRSLKWDQGRYEFPEDTEATSMIARAPRPGFETAPLQSEGSRKL